ncbi:uncharacterized protein LOC108253473 [Diaphorina citri]|uniref:Uncharacterized protein LOC108253473 n=1 Tax=Diaphorina citri TaxID=121845 RepID=A0A1S4ELF1_DIACI|nr:uncharacterized protein LOC108253473 [Diaphorina citri]
MQRAKHLHCTLHVKSNLTNANVFHVSENFCTDTLVSVKMPNRKVILASAVFLFMYALRENGINQLPQPVRRWWRTELYRKRSKLVRELREQQLSGQYKNFTRMTPTDFEYILSQIGGKISKVNTRMRAAVSAEDRLALTLRFLATGDSYTSLQYTFRISKQTISTIVPEVCEAIIDVIKNNIKVSLYLYQYFNLQFKEYK